MFPREKTTTCAFLNIVISDHNGNLNRLEQAGFRTFSAISLQFPCSVRKRKQKGQQSKRRRRQKRNPQGVPVQGPDCHLQLGRQFAQRKYRPAQLLDELLIG